MYPAVIVCILFNTSSYMHLNIPKVLYESLALHLIICIYFVFSLSLHLIIFIRCISLYLFTASHYIYSLHLILISVFCCFNFFTAHSIHFILSIALHTFYYINLFLCLSFSATFHFILYISSQLILCMS